jgi:hypothetical protein
MSVDYRAAWVPFDQDNGQTRLRLRSQSHGSSRSARSTGESVC